MADGAGADGQGLGVLAAGVAAMARVHTHRTAGSVAAAVASPHPLDHRLVSSHRGGAWWWPQTVESRITGKGGLKCGRSFACSRGQATAYAQESGLHTPSLKALRRARRVVRSRSRASTAMRSRGSTKALPGIAAANGKKDSSAAGSSPWRTCAICGPTLRSEAPAAVNARACVCVRVRAICRTQAS